MKFLIRKRVDEASGVPRARYWFVLVTNLGEPVASSDMLLDKDVVIRLVQTIKAEIHPFTPVVDETHET